MQATSAGTLMLTSERTRLADLDEKAEGFVLMDLEMLPTDLSVNKIVDSAFINGSSDIDAKLRSRSIESAARDAMMRVTVVANSNGSFFSATC